MKEKTWRENSWTIWGEKKGQKEGDRNTRIGKAHKTSKDIGDNSNSNRYEVVFPQSSTDNKILHINNKLITIYNHLQVVFLPLISVQSLSAWVFCSKLLCSFTFKILQCTVRSGVWPFLWMRKAPLQIVLRKYLRIFFSFLYSAWLILLNSVQRPLRFEPWKHTGKYSP